MNFEKAVNLGKKRKYLEASRIFLSITKETSEIPEAYLFLGRSYHSLKQFPEAVQFLNHYLSLIPNSPTGNFFLGRSLLSMDFAKNAVKYLKFAVESRPESIHANGFLGIAYLKSGRSDIALTYLQKAAESSSPQAGIYKIYLGTLFVRAVYNFKLGNYDMASQMFGFLIDKNFDSILPYIYMGMIERYYNNYTKALDYYEKALEFSPSDKLLLYRRAVLLHKTGNSSLAVEELKKLNIEPEVDENIYLAYQYFNNKEFHKAVYYANIALHEDNSNIDLHLLLGEANRALDKLEIAENHYNIAIKLDRSRLEGRYGLALLLWIKQDYKRMIVELNKINISDPGNSISSYYKTLCMCKANYDTEITIPSIQEEIRKSKPDCYLLNSLGEEYIKADFRELAEKWFLKSIVLNKDFVEAYLNLIAYYKDSEEDVKLMDTYKSYLNINFDTEKNIEYIQILYKSRNYNETIKQVLFILPSTENKYKLLRILANSYRFTKNWNSAIMTYRQVLLKNPEDENILQSLIYCLDRNNKTETAIELIDNALGYLKHPSINLHLIKGVLCFKNKQFNTALDIFRAALNKSPNDWRIYNNIAIIYKEKGLKDYADQFFSRAAEYKNK
ncbi:MAG: tetratricopeptide repeat protein [Spirochaetaceae bacterium]|nr:tetratricopeptide repeat protein [Spirochaetaceae bacterium]